MLKISIETLTKITLFFVEVLTEISFMAEEIFQIIESEGYGEVSFDFCPRSRNVAAHRLVRVAITDPPVCCLVLSPLPIRKRTKVFGLDLPQIE